MPLLYVLWSIALLTVIAATIQHSGVVSYTQSRHTVDTARYSALTEAVIARTVLALHDKRPSRQSRFDHGIIRFDMEDIRAVVTVQDETGRIDINHADANLLAALFRIIGEETNVSAQIADRILDWRDTDHLQRLNGAEAGQYREIGREGYPRNGPFQSIGELRLVFGMTEALYQRAAPLLTVYSGKPMVDPAIALPEIRQALGRQSVSSQTGGQRIGSPSRILAGRAFLLKIAIYDEARVIQRKAVIRLTGRKQEPYWLLSLTD